MSLSTASNEIFADRYTTLDAATKAGVGSNIDTILAREMNSLSFQERNKLQEEVHGVATLAIEEVPELVDTSLEALRKEIEKFPPIYSFQQHDAATFSYAYSDAFLLKFLRADLFRVQNATKRFMSHCDLLCRYFGVFALQRPLTLSDLNRKEMSILRAGHFQLMSRDRSGRLVEFHNCNIDFENVNVANLVRMTHFRCIKSSTLHSRHYGLLLRLP